MPQKINFSVEEYSEIINWMHCGLFSLPLLAETNEDEIKSHMDSDSIPEWIITFKQIPIYMQAVQRQVILFAEPP